jgi:hypothetical protein
MTKTISLLTAAAVFSVFATAYAQNEQAPAQMQVPNQEMAPPPAVQAPAQAPSMGEEKKADKPAKSNGSHGKGKAKGHAKKTGKKGKDKTAGAQ